MIKDNKKHLVIEFICNEILILKIISIYAASKSVTNYHCKHS